MSCMYQYRCEDANGDFDMMFDNKAEAIKYAREHHLKVVEEEYEYSDSYPVEGGDFLQPQKEYVVVLKRETVEEKRVRVVAPDSDTAAAWAQQGGEVLTDWQLVEKTVQFKRIEGQHPNALDIAHNIAPGPRG